MTPPDVTPPDVTSPGVNLPAQTAIDVHIVAKAFASPEGAIHTILQNIHLAAAPGEVVALLGPSGIGKTTLLRIILGLDTAFDGRVQTRAGPVGVVFQDPRLLPWLTVADNLRLVMTSQTTRAIPSHINTLLERAGVPGIADRRPAELSLGMARRVALARALAVDPVLLVLDEPFASLDVQLGSVLAARVADDARRAGCTVLMATHELDHALAVADRICVLAGRPATLAATVAVPAPGDLPSIARLRATLLQQFSFLAPRSVSPAP